MKRTDYLSLPNNSLTVTILPFSHNLFHTNSKIDFSVLVISGLVIIRPNCSFLDRVLRENGVIVLDLPDREFGDIRKDGIYIHNPGGQKIFIGYVPTQDEMKQFLTEAGFENIEIKKWQTQNGFHKITYVGKKQHLVSDA